MALLQFETIHQAHGNSCRVVSPVFPPKETLKKVRQTSVDTSNKALWSMVKILQEFFTHQLRAVGMASSILQSVPDKSVLLSTTFMCAHDTFNDSGVQVTPHLVADCTEISKQLADIIAKHNAQDNEEQQPYELIARNAEKAAQKAEKKLTKAKKAVAAAAKKVKAKSNANAPAKTKQNKLLAKAQKAVVDAQAAFDKANKDASEASKKAKVVSGIQSNIIKRWQGGIAKMKPAGVGVGDAIVIPTCMERCQLHLAPSSKSTSAKGTCTNIKTLTV